MTIKVVETRKTRVERMTISVTVPGTHEGFDAQDGIINARIYKEWKNYIDEIAPNANDIDIPWESPNVWNREANTWTCTLTIEVTTIADDLPAVTLEWIAETLNDSGVQAEVEGAFVRAKLYHGSLTKDEVDRLLLGRVSQNNISIRLGTAYITL